MSDSEEDGVYLTIIPLWRYSGLIPPLLDPGRNEFNLYDGTHLGNSYRIIHLILLVTTRHRDGDAGTPGNNWRVL